MRLAALERAWSLLTAPYRRKHLTLVRRDLQRHALLAAGHAVPPTAMLDAAWRTTDDATTAFLALAAGAELQHRFLQVHLAPFAASHTSDTTRSTDLAARARRST